MQSETLIRETTIKVMHADDKEYRDLLILTVVGEEHARGEVLIETCKLRQMYIIGDILIFHFFF